VITVRRALGGRDERDALVLVTVMVLTGLSSSIMVDA
jgi:hypothetical protein